MSEISKFCKGCATDHPVTMFSSAGQGGRLRPMCKPCTSAREKSLIDARRRNEGEKPAAKCCTRCRTEMPNDTMHFKKKAGGSHGLTSECKKCLGARSLAWTKTERGRSTKAKWINENRSKVRLSALRYQVRNREKVNAYLAKWRTENIERRRESDRINAANHREARAVYRHLRRAAGTVSKGDITRLEKLQRGCCAICRASLNGSREIDHVVPVKKGGASNFTNLQLLCRPCNRSKGARDPIDHMQRIGFLL